MKQELENIRGVLKDSLDKYLETMENTINTQKDHRDNNRGTKSIYEEIDRRICNLLKMQEYIIEPAIQIWKDKIDRINLDDTEDNHEIKDDGNWSEYRPKVR